MIKRPKPGESEDDLLKFQQEFLAKQEKSAASVVKKPDKRKTEHSAGTIEKDVVEIESNFVFQHLKFIVKYADVLKLCLSRDHQSVNSLS